LEKKKSSKSASLTFDKALVQLEEIARQLDSGELGLEESIERYEEGMRLSKFCQESLEKAERKIVLLQKKGDKVQQTEVAVTEDTGEIENDDEVQGSLL
jgi:exodeoxyribonuclease VII small subunit